MKNTAFQEKKQHGSPDFPIAYYLVDCRHPQYVMPLHWHRELEIVRVRQGLLHIYLNNTAFQVGPGDLLFIGSGVLHRAEPVDCLYECVVFDPNLLGSRLREHVLSLLSGQCTIRPWFPAQQSPLTDTAAELFESMAQRAPHYALAVHGSLAKLLYLLYEGGHILYPKRTGRTGQQARIITRVLDYIEENYCERITLHQLAAVAAVHEKYLCRIFKEYTGRTPIDYVNQLRIEHACVGLTLHHQNVTEAATDAGFTDLSYFTKLFKREKGVTPREYAKANR